MSKEDNRKERYTSTIADNLIITLPDSAYEYLKGETKSEDDSTVGGVGE